MSSVGCTIVRAITFLKLRSQRDEDIKVNHEHFSLPVAVLGHEISEFVVIGSGLRMLRS